MKLSTRARYGTRALLDIALNAGDRPILLRDIAKRQEISPLYLVHLITPLVASGIIRSTRGARGGVWLAKAPKDIGLYDVIKLLEGSIAPVECVSDPKYCSRSSTCVTRDIWSEMRDAMVDVLASKTLQDLIDREKEKRQHSGQGYDI